MGRTQVGFSCYCVEKEDGKERLEGEEDEKSERKDDGKIIIFLRKNKGK